jgi:cation diffusion facilitator family transporter
MTAEAHAADHQGQQRTAAVSIAAAMFLVALKLGTGIATGSLGLISAGIESSGDVIAAVLTLLAIRLGNRPADDDHPFGHRRAENLGALGEAAILIGGGIFVAVEAIGQLAEGGESVDARWYIFLVIAVALMVDASRIAISLRTARKYRSAALRSNAFHFAGDLVGSLAVLGGMLAVAAGVEAGDAIAALVVACVIFGAASRLIYENARVLMDTAPVEARAVAVQAVLDLGDEIELRRVRVRESGGRYFADVVVAVSPGRALVAGHSAADAVEASIERALPGSDVVVHVEPRRDGLDVRDRVLAAALGEPAVGEVHDITIYEHQGRTSVSLHLKFEPDTSLPTAHDVAERVEATIKSAAGVDHVMTHLEPLEQPVPALPVGEDDGVVRLRRVEELVTDRTGLPPAALRELMTEDGPVIFVAVGVLPATSLADAHDLASRLEDEIRAGQPHMRDVVVHTEP